MDYVSAQHATYLNRLPRQCNVQGHLQVHSHVNHPSTHVSHQLIQASHVPSGYVRHQVPTHVVNQQPSTGVSQQASSHVSHQFAFHTNGHQGLVHPGQAYPSQYATSSVPVNPQCRNIGPERNHPHGGGITHASDTPHGGGIVQRRDIPHGGGIPAKAILNSTGNQSRQPPSQDPTALDDPNQPLVTAEQEHYYSLKGFKAGIESTKINSSRQAVNVIDMIAKIPPAKILVQLYLELRVVIDKNWVCKEWFPNSEAKERLNELDEVWRTYMKQNYLGYYAKMPRKNVQPKKADHAINSEPAKACLQSHSTNAKPQHQVQQQQTDVLQARPSRIPIPTRPKEASPPKMSTIQVQKPKSRKKSKPVMISTGMQTVEEVSVSKHISTSIQVDITKDTEVKSTQTDDENLLKKEEVEKKKNKRSPRSQSVKTPSTHKVAKKNSKPSQMPFSLVGRKFGFSLVKTERGPSRSGTLVGILAHFVIASVFLPKLPHLLLT